jgi:hypothetical protein
MSGSVSASSCSVRRSRRPQTRLETSCTRTGRPRRHLRPVGQQVGGRRPRPHGPRVRHRGVTLRHSTDEPFEQRRNARRRRVGREGCGSRRTLFHLTRTRLSAGLRVSHGWRSVRRSVMLSRYSSAIRTGCANERPSGSVRVVPWKLMEFSFLKWRPRQSLARSRVPSLSWCPATAIAKRRQGGCRPEQQ